MGARIQVYLDPSFLGKVPESLLDSPDLYSFERKVTSRLINGADEQSKIFYDQLEANEQDLLDPKGFIGEENKKKLQPIDPQVLKSLLLKLYRMMAEYYYSDNDSEIQVPADTHPSSFFLWLQQDIAGAVLICDLAIERGCGVYWALG